jgi:NTE family protein
MIAFVLGGGGNLGVLKIGALMTLLEEGIYPEMLVGTSVGAINAAFMASDPSIYGVHELAEIWKHIKKENIYPGSPLNMAWHLATQQDSLCSRKNLAAFIQRHTPTGVRTFCDMKVPLYIVATDLLTGHRYLFGDDPDEHIVDALLASTSIPPVFSPWCYRGRLLVDGGVSENLPISVGVEKGATEIYALDILREGPMDDGHWNVVEVATMSLMNLIAQQRNRDLSIYASYPGITLHYLPLYPFKSLAFDDFNHAEELIEIGREAARAYLIDQKLSKPIRDNVQLKSHGLQIITRTRDFLTGLISHFSFSGQS